MSTNLGILRSRLKAVSRAAAKELGRYSIDGIHVREDCIVATNGKLMLEAPVELDGNKADHKRRILSPESAKMLLADKYTKKRGNVSLESNDKFRAFGTDIGVLPLLHRDADFPDTDGVRVKDESVGFEFNIAAGQLAIIAAAALDVDDAEPRDRHVPISAQGRRDRRGSRDRPSDGDRVVPRDWRCDAVLRPLLAGRPVMP